MRLKHSPHNPLRSWADGSQVLVSLQDCERRVSHIEAVELPLSLVFVHGEIFNYCSLCIQKCPLRTQRHTHTRAVQIFLQGPGLYGRYHKSCCTEIRKSNEKPCSQEGRLGVKGKRQCWVSHLRRALQLLISATQQTHQNGRFDIISRGGRAAGHREVYYFIMWNMIPWVTVTLENQAQR